MPVCEARGSEGGGAGSPHTPLMEGLRLREGSAEGHGGGRGVSGLCPMCPCVRCRCCAGVAAL